MKQFLEVEFGIRIPVDHLETICDHASHGNEWEETVVVFVVAYVRPHVDTLLM